MPKPGILEVKTGGSASAFSSPKNLPASTREAGDLLGCLTNVCTACASRLQCEAYQRRCPLFHQPQYPEQDLDGLRHLLVNAISVILGTAGPASRQAHPSGATAEGTSQQKNASEAIPEGDLRDKPEDDLLAIEDVIKRTKLSRRKLLYDMAAGALPYCKFGRATRFAPHDVDSYIAARRIGRKNGNT